MRERKEKKQPRHRSIVKQNQTKPKNVHIVFHLFSRWLLLLLCLFHILCVACVKELVKNPLDASHIVHSFLVALIVFICLRFPFASRALISTQKRTHIHIRHRQRGSVECAMQFIFRLDFHFRLFSLDDSSFKKGQSKCK